VNIDKPSKQLRTKSANALLTLSQPAERMAATAMLDAPAAPRAQECRCVRRFLVCSAGVSAINRGVDSSLARSILSNVAPSSIKGNARRQTIVWRFQLQRLRMQSPLSGGH